MNRLHAGIVAVLVATGCGDVSGSESSTAAEARTSAAADLPLPSCEVAAAGQLLPEAVRETSGLAQGRRDAGVFWTHNDAGNAPDLFAVNAGGRLLGTVRIDGVDPIDWEDIESAACSTGDCLYVADTGDNGGDRDFVTVYELAEPGATSDGAATAIPHHARFPDGRWDAEALFILPDSELYLVTKGRRGPIALYRYPSPRATGEIAELERVRELFPEPENGDDRVTAATTSPDGRWVGIVTARTLRLYPADALVGGGAVEPASIDLRPLGHPQSEAIAIGADGTVWISTEAENSDDDPRLSSLRCTFPAP
ncbi:MAG: hypothetical protein WD766_06450 [Gemmatimonadota bacterium]